MSAPSWIRRLSETDEDRSEYGIPTASLYSSISSGSAMGSRVASSGYLNRSRENVTRSRENMTDLRLSSMDLRNDHTPDVYSSRNQYSNYGTGRRSSHDISRGRFAASNNSYTDDNGASNYSRNKGDIESNTIPRFVAPRDRMAKESRDSRDTRGNGNTRRMSDANASEISTTTADSSRTGKRNHKREPNRNDSWSYVDSDGYSNIPPSIHTSASYGEFEGNTSTASGSSYMHAHRTPGHTAHNSTDTEKKKRRRRKEPPLDDARASSGYNSYSELSEFANTSRSSDEHKHKTHKSNHRGSQQDLDKGDRYSRFPKRRSSTTVEEKTLTVAHSRCDSKMSVSESELSGSSKDQKKRKSSEKTKSNSLDNFYSDAKTAPTIGNVAVTVTNNIQYDPNDPFSFIQPVAVPFHVKVRKCMGPITAVLLLCIVAVALGAAIYFASALKETQDDQIEMLRANLAMKIRNADELSMNNFEDLSSTYCKQMDIFYAESKFRNTYRGCKVVSLTNNYINFTLFFVEKEATSSQIIGVIETSAERKQDNTKQLAVVDKFELELDNVEVTMDRRMEKETFNMKTPTVIPSTPSSTTTTTTARSTTTSTVAHTQKATSRILTTLKEGTKKPTSASTLRPNQPTSASTLRPTKPTPVTPRTVRVTRKPGKRKTPPTYKPIYSWDPCSEYDGNLFPHPTDCDKFFQCSNGVSIGQACAPGLFFDWRELSCFDRFTITSDCPDPSKAPAKPTTTTTTTPKPTTTTTATSTTKAESNTHEEATTIDPFLMFTDDILVPTASPKVSLTVIAANFSLRRKEKYSETPCSVQDVNLYPHPHDCAAFIQCVNGESHVMSCQNGLVFDPAINTCVLQDPELICKDIKPCANVTTEKQYFEHPTDCSKFIQCENGRHFVKTCKTGLVWSSGVNTCVHKTPNIKCPMDGFV